MITHHIVDNRDRILDSQRVLMHQQARNSAVRLDRLGEPVVIGIVG